jgi:hypothetical protein
VVRVTKRAILAGAAALAVAAGACGGKVAVDEPGAGNAGATGNTGGFGAFAAGGALAAGGSSAQGGAGAGGVCVDSCAQAITDGYVTCSGSVADPFYQALYACACGASPCAMVCQFELCVGQASQTDCGTCLLSVCTQQYNDCSNN